MLKKCLLLFAISLYFGGFAQVAKDPQLFWEITSPKGKKSYIYGTFHSNDKKVFNLPDSLYTVLKNTELLVVETDMFAIVKDLEVRSTAFSMRFDTHGLPYSSTNEAGETVYGTEDGMPHFLDMYLLNLAQLNGIEYTTLEAMETQIKLTKTNVAEPDSIYMDEVLMSSTLEGLYINGDIAGIDKLLRKYYSNSLYQRTIVDRNLAMTNRIDTLLQNTRGVVLVGSAHLGGSFGVLKFLKDAHWKVRLVSAVVTDKAEDKQTMRKQKVFVLEEEELQFHSEWAGAPIEMDREGALNYYFFKELGQGNVYSVELIEKESYPSLEDVVNDYMLSPGDAKTLRYLTDDGYVYFEGISDSYPEGYAWVRIIEGQNAYAVLKAFGGNKFMNSDRPRKFFNGCWFMD